MTNREFYTAVSNGTINDEVKEFATEAIAKLDARNANRSAKPTKTQQANANLREVVLNVLRNEGKPMTVTEVFNAMSENPEVASTQKVSALMRQLLLDGKVAKTTEKRVSYFSAV